MHIINLNYLINKFLYFIKFLDNNIKESNKTLKGLNNTAIISDNDYKYLLNLFDLEA